MKIAAIILCSLTVVYCQTKNNNGNPTGEIGSPAFDEIVVESTLTVRGKPGSRSGKSLVTNQKPKVTEVKSETVKADTNSTNEATVTLKRSKRVPRQRFEGPSRHNQRKFGQFDNFAGSSSSAAQASSNSFNSQTPFGSFGASASQSSSQSQNFSPDGGFQGSAGQSASQTYRLPNGNQIDVSFSNGFSVGNGRPSFSNSHAVTLTRPDGSKQQLYGRK